MDDKTNWNPNQELKRAPEKLSITTPPAKRHQDKLLNALYHD